MKKYYVEYAPHEATPFTTTEAIVVLGDCMADSAGYKADVKTVETSAGTQLYAGKVETFEVKV